MAIAVCRTETKEAELRVAKWDVCILNAENQRDLLIDWKRRIRIKDDPEVFSLCK